MSFCASKFIPRLARFKRFTTLAQRGKPAGRAIGSPHPAAGAAPRRHLARSGRRGRVLDDGGRRRRSGRTPARPWAKSAAAADWSTRRGKQVARFTQRYRLAYGARVVQIETDLETDQPPGSDPWESYYAARFAWPDEDVEIYRDVGLGRQASEARRLEAPHFVELRSTRARTTILTAGLPYHRRAGGRMLDSLLVSGGARRAAHSAMPWPLTWRIPCSKPGRYFLRPWLCPGARRPAGPHRSNWLFHVDAKNIVVTHWDALRDEVQGPLVRVRLAETEGLAGRGPPAGFARRCPGAAYRFSRSDADRVACRRDCVTIDVAPFEVVELEARLHR